MGATRVLCTAVPRRDAVVRIVKKSEHTKYLAYYTRAGVERHPVSSLSYLNIRGDGPSGKQFPHAGLPRLSFQASLLTMSTQSLLSLALISFLFTSAASKRVPHTFLDPPSDAVDHVNP